MKYIFTQKIYCSLVNQCNCVANDKMLWIICGYGSSVLCADINEPVSCHISYVMFCVLKYGEYVYTVILAFNLEILLL